MKVLRFPVAPKILYFLFFERRDLVQDWVKQKIAANLKA